MSEPKVPPRTGSGQIGHGLGDGTVPDKALEELLAAFAAESPTEQNEIDLDDPSIDLLLGLDSTEAATNVVPAIEAAPTDVVSAIEAAPTDVVPAIEAAPTDAVEQVDAAPPVSEDPSAPHDLPTVEQPSTPAPLDAAADGTGEPAVASGTASSAPPRAPIKIGGDELDLPDPVYLDEEGEERLRGTSGRATEASIREERTTILIGGDEIEGSSGGIPIGTGSASMDPRLRARRIAVKRAMSRRRLKWILIPTIVVVIVAGGLALLGSSLFAVDSVAISGNHRISETDLDAAVADLKGKPVLLVDTNEIESRLEKSPWVREARVTTDFPHHATIELSERQPLATYQGTDGRFRIIDVEGRVVDVLAGQPIEFMTISGPALNAEAGGWAGEWFTHAAELVEALSPGVRSRTGAIAVSETGDLSLVFRNDAKTEVVLGAPTQLLDKLTRLEALLKNTDTEGCTRIDVTTADSGRQCPRT